MKLTTVVLLSAITACLLQNSQLHGQSYTYWTQNFNEESSLLSGAVVGGGSGASAIYFNPAAIAAGGKTMFSINASLFSLEFFSMKNALGNGIDLNTSKFIIQPRFVSFLLQPKWNENISMEVAIFNNASYDLRMEKTEDRLTDIIPSLPGDERYYATFRYWNKYRDDWLGVGGAWRASPKILLGISWFGSIKSLKYETDIDIVAMPLLDTVVADGEPISFYSANWNSSEALRFNDYRMLLKFGMLYTESRLSIGLTLKTPSIYIYDDGKRASRKEKQSNIMDNSGDDFMRDFIIADSQEKKTISTNYKDPLSLAIGFMLNNHDESSTGFLTFEYFSRINPYKMISVPVNPNMTTKEIFEKMDNQEWLSFAHAAKPVLNIAIGYRKKIAENLVFLCGFKTDLNSRKGVDYKSYSGYNTLQSLDLNVYRVSTGLRLNIRGHDLVTGLNYGFGYEKGRTQFVNLSDPVEFNSEEGRALQGTRQNNVTIMHNSISLYFGANLRLQN
jgi:hypothetical protein